MIIISLTFISCIIFVRYDAFADHSGFQQQQLSTSDSHLLSDADRLEVHFQDTYNRDNVGQFKRVIFLIGLYQSFYTLLGIYCIFFVSISIIINLTLFYLSINY